MLLLLKNVYAQEWKLSSQHPISCCGFVAYQMKLKLYNDGTVKHLSGINKPKNIKYTIKDNLIIFYIHNPNYSTKQNKKLYKFTATKYAVSKKDDLCYTLKSLKNKRLIIDMCKL